MVSWMQDCMPLAGESSVRQLVFRLGGQVGLGRRNNFGKFDVWLVTLKSLILGGGRFWPKIFLIRKNNRVSFSNISWYVH